MLRRILFATALLGLLFTVSCAQTASTEVFYTRVTDSVLTASSALPVPSGDVILTVTGKIGAANVSDTIQMDLAMIESVGEYQYPVTDPFDQSDRIYRGPLMTDLLALWKVADDATSVEIAALDDYTVAMPIEDLRKYPVLFALQQDGAYMPVSTRGPAMLVFPYNNFSFNHEIFNDYWVWQISSMDFR